MPLNTLGTDPDYASLYAGRHDPRLLMAQKLMELDKAPTTNSTQSSFWANLLNQGGRGLLGGYMMNQVQGDAEKERTKQEKEAGVFEKKMNDFMAGGRGGAAPAPAPGPVQAAAPAMRADAGGDLVAAVHNNESSGRMEPGIFGDGGKAAGPMQVHAGALADVNRALGTNYTHQQLAAEPEIGKRVGAEYLRQMQAMFPDPALALAAYQAGPGTVQRAVASGQGLAGLSPHTQDYVRRALAFKGQQADASPPPGSNIDALMAGVNQPKPRGIQLAENLLPGGTATDAPTPILPNPMAGADPGYLQNRNGVVPDPASVPQPQPASVPAPSVVPNGPTPADVPQPASASVPDNPLTRADPGTLANINGLPLPPPAVQPPPEAAAAAPYPPAALQPQPEAAQVPPPAAAEVPQPPEPTPTIPNPQAGVDPGALANFNGQPQPAPATVPLPVPPLVPQPPAAQVPPLVPQPPAAQVPPPAPATVPPQYGPPPPPRGVQLAAPLVTPPAAPGGAGPLDLFKQAGIPSPYDAAGAAPAAGGGPSGPQLAAALQEPTTPDEAAAYSDARGPSGGPTGQQLAAPLLPPQPVGTGAGPQPQQPQPPSSQDRADGLLRLAREAAGSSNPRIRAYAGVLEAQAAMEQRRIDQQTGRDERRTDRQDARDDAAANRRAAQETALANRPPVTREVTGDDGKVRYQEFDYGTRTWKDTGMLGPKQKGDGGGPYAGKGIQAEDSNMVLTLGPKIANGTATDAERSTYGMAYNRLRDGPVVDIPDPADPSRTVKSRLPGQDMSAFPPPGGGPVGGAPGQSTNPNAPHVVPGTSKPVQTSEGERNAAGFAVRMEAADKIMAEVGDPSWRDMLAGKAGMVGNYLTTPKGQQFQQAAQAWIRAKLRKESGAAIGKDEMEQEFQTYFPQPGDSPEKLKQKQEFRERETAAMRTSAGRAYTPKMSGNEALAAARRELGDGATDDAILGRARELMNGR